MDISYGTILTTISVAHSRRAGPRLRGTNQDVCQVPDWYGPSSLVPTVVPVPKGRGVPTNGCPTQPQALFEGLRCWSKCKVIGKKLYRFRDLFRYRREVMHCLSDFGSSDSQRLP